MRSHQFRFFMACGVVLTMSACAGVDEGWRFELALAPHHSSCLIQGHLVHTPRYTECVLALYEQRKEQEARLHIAVAPAPAPEPASVFPFGAND